MKTRHLLCVAAFTSAAFLTGSAIAADAGTTTTQIQNEPSTAAPSPNRVTPSPQWIGGSERVDNSNAVAPNGMAPSTVPPQWSDYDVPPNYPARDVTLPPRTGSDVIPDYMGPGSVRGQ
jgi:hypothetical protein